MQALGNDFLLLRHADCAGIKDVARLARRVCDRHHGIGADGLMIVEELSTGARTRLHNADGGVAELSGNGIRCAAAWLADLRGLAADDTLVIDTAAGPRQLVLTAREGKRFTFRADMGAPTGVRRERLLVGDENVDVVVLGVGNPQCVVLGPATEDRLHRLGAGLTNHPSFPDGTNVELAEVEAPDRVRILIWERGVGPTEASGTGACAAAVAAAFAGGAGRAVEVHSPGGSQHVEWTETTIFLTGWAELVAVVNFLM